MFTMYEIVTNSTLLPCPDMSLVGKGGGGVVAVVMCGVVEGREEREKGFEVYILKIE